MGEASAVPLFKNAVTAGIRNTTIGTLHHSDSVH